MSKPQVKIKRKDISSFDLNNVITKLRNLQTSNKIASHFNHVYKEVVAAQKSVADDYLKEIMGKYGKKDEAGKLIVDKDNPKGIIAEETDDLPEFKKDIETFGETYITLDWGPIRPSHLLDAKMSAKELDSLKDLYVDEDGPGVPKSHLTSVS